MHESGVKSAGNLKGDYPATCRSIGLQERYVAGGTSCNDLSGAIAVCLF
jgi:hypothetical protein